MRYVPWHVKRTRPEARGGARDVARRAGLSIAAAFALIRKDVQELRRQTSRPQADPAVLGQQLRDIAARIDALQSSAQCSNSADRMDAFLAQLNALLSQNESKLSVIQQQVAAAAGAAISGPAESIRRDVASLKEIQAAVDRRTQDLFEAVYDTIERIVDRLVAVEDELRHPVDEAPAAAPQTADATAIEHVGKHDGGAMAPSDAAPSNVVDADVSATPRLRHPAVPDFAAEAAPDPGSVPDGKGAAGVASQAAEGRTEAGGRPAMRAGCVAATHQADRAVTTGRQTGPAAPVANAGPDSRQPSSQRTPFRTPTPRLKSALLCGSVAVLMVGAVLVAVDFFYSPAQQELTRPVAPPNVAPQARNSEADADDIDEPDHESVRMAAPSSDQAPPRPVAGFGPPAAWTPFNGNPLPESSMRSQERADVPADMAAMLAIPLLAAPQKAIPASDTDASLMRNLLLPTPAGPDPWVRSGSSVAARGLRARPLPSTIGGKALLAAASAGNPGACYEVAIRFAQGRNGAPDFVMAAAWLECAAQRGLTPAQFRLGSMYEKGLGVRKDIAEARRLYVAAAAKGHAKAMHNLAVLYSGDGGIDGAPDYAAAAEWFRRAAGYGVIDSQYNLAILYARGTGVERDLAESYKWFALAAKAGDKDAVRKRDEIAAGLDPKQLESARLNVEAFVVATQPEEAVAVKAPAGGWDQLAAAAATKSRAPAPAERFPPR